MKNKKKIRDEIKKRLNKDEDNKSRKPPEIKKTDAVGIDTDQTKPQVGKISQNVTHKM